MLEWITLAIALAACILAYQGVAFYKADRQRILAFFEEARPVIRDIATRAGDEDYIAVVASKAVEKYLPQEVMYDMVRGVSQHVAEGSLPYIMDRIEDMTPKLIASAFSTDLARELQSKSVAARSITQLGTGTKGPQALQFGLQKLLGGINIPMDQVIAGYKALKELEATRKPSNGHGEQVGGVVIDYGLPSAVEVGGT